ncbi:MAG: radical SAM peptide maturase, CXXX-repeat target family [Bacteroidales bacterium]|nr:radical SAM peptide maturase, CXXX-repeat target family [Bacteroidales bacterium]
MKAKMDLYKIKDNEPAWQSGMSKNITFIVTKDCQLACKYCYLVGKNVKERMSWETAKTFVDYVLEHEDEFREESVVWDFIGGEPFLEIELIDKICDYLKLRMFELNHHWFNSYRFSFSTNGINYHTSEVQSFIKKNREHISIGITIDGTEKKHDLNRVWKQPTADANGLTQPSERGSYKDVVKNIPLWLSQFPDAGTKVTISSADIPYIKESVLHLYSLGIHQVNINVVFEDVWQEGDDARFEEQLMELADAIIDGGWYQDYACSFFSEHIGKSLDPERDNQNWCGAGRMLSVDAAGNLYPCTRFAQYSLRSKKALIIGNIKDGINENLLRPFLTLDRITQSPQKCLDCEVASGCAWCQGENYDAAQTNTIYERSTAICLMHKARVRANNYYWNKLYRKLELEGRREEFEKNERDVKPEIC